MLLSYLKRAIRNMTRNKISSFINIGGLSIGIAVSMIIGFWIWDELSYDSYHTNHNKVARVMQNQHFSGEIHTDKAIAIPLATALRGNYASEFKSVVLSSWTNQHLLSAKDKNILKPGNFMEPAAPEMLTLKMVYGARSGLNDPGSILLCHSLSKALFGEVDPVGQRVDIDSKLNTKVSGVYEDIPDNSSFRDLQFIAPWELYVSSDDGIKNDINDWGQNGYQLFVQVADNRDIKSVSDKIEKVKFNSIGKKDAKDLQPAIFLHPMNRWYLYPDFINGVNTGGRIDYVWMFGTIGIIVLLLACINFMNLSTARSEKRAKEVGILKAIGSERGQLIRQFYCESILVAMMAFLVALVLMQLILPFFNTIAVKNIQIPWTNPIFWTTGLGYTLFTGLIAGSYPALYLSSFKAVKVLKGSIRAGRHATAPRKILVVFQFTVSLILITGTVVVFRQIQFAKNRPVGYDRDRLVLLRMYTMDLYTHFDVVRNELLESGYVKEMSASLNSITNLGRQSSGFEWKDKTADQSEMFAVVGVTPEFGKTIHWEITKGRDFSRSYATDSAGLILNEAAVKYMGLQNPIGELVKWNKNYKVLGVVKNIVVGSPYDPVKPAIYYIDPELGGVFNIRINPRVDLKPALAAIETVCKKFGPSAPFDYKIADEEYSKKFNDAERVGNLSVAFALFAIFISCLGVFGLASFVAEQRKREIGLRKVLGATVFSLWKLLSKDFVKLVIISIVIATPVAWYCMKQWLQNYQYRIDLSLWLFAATGAGVLLITLITVSYQSIRAALANPVKTLRTE